MEPHQVSTNVGIASRSLQSRCTRPRPPTAAFSPPILPAGTHQPQTFAIAGVGSPLLSPPPSGPSSSAPSPSLAAQQTKPKRRRNKRLVALDNVSGDVGYRSSEDGGRASPRSNSAVRAGARSKSPKKMKEREAHTPAPISIPDHTAKDSSSIVAPASPPPEEQTPIRRSRHSRYHTEFGPSLPPDRRSILASPEHSWALESKVGYAEFIFQTANAGLCFRL